MEVALERAGEVRGDCAETGWRVAENRRGRDWLPALWAQRAARAACGLLPPSLGGPCPPPAQNSDIKAARAIHSLFGCHKNHYKNFTKDPEGILALPSRLGP